MVEKHRKDNIVDIIQINSEPVELCKILKFGGMALSGGSAKHMISNNEILVNNQLETKKRKKLMAGDIISIGKKSYVLALKSTICETDN